MDVLNLLELEELARERLAPEAYNYIAGGAEDEVTVRENRAAFERIRLRPRFLVDVSEVDAGVEIYGQPIGFPVMLSPTGFQGLTHPEAELATARGAERADTLMAVSTASTRTLEEIGGATGGPKWFQLYCHPEREVTRELVERVERSGAYSALCVTVDVPRLGRRERELRNRVHLPADAVPGNFRDRLDTEGMSPEERDAAVVGLLARSLTWEDIDWLRSLTETPLLLKGILTAEDAALAVEHGVDGIVVSNHGGRQLDGSIATIDALPEVVDAVAGRVDVFLDGGVRRGTDVIKALALGARAVMIGRPYLWGLAIDGADGVARVLEMLRSEVELAMALTGCPRVDEITPDRVARARS